MIKNRITFKQLEALVQVADTGTFRKAAEMLGTTQPNVSVRISTLEEALGVKLMHRDAGSVRFTEPGREVLSVARDVLRAGERLLETAGRHDLVEDRLRLGVGELIAATWLHDFLRTLKAAYPAVRVELTVDLSSELERMLSEGQLDLILANGPFRGGPVDSVDLADYAYGWVGDADLVGSLDPNPDLKDLFEIGILTHGKSTGASQALRAHLTANGLDPARITHSSSLTSTLQMAADGMGIALLPKRLSAGLEHLRAAEGLWVPDSLRFAALYDANTSARFVKRAARMAADQAATDLE
ncbi:LysR family transcriptional regulator [Gymnodinialimonas hymeniacidonis]|uniref:LysR family transcriptional regulator n=1 Tax=Gymnodinialimonas hymeniacidonis TaxID=3126508 RepID=UPI0034C6C9DE